MKRFRSHFPIYSYLWIASLNKQRNIIIKAQQKGRKKSSHRFSFRVKSRDCCCASFYYTWINGRKEDEKYLFNVRTFIHTYWSSSTLHWIIIIIIINTMSFNLSYFFLFFVSLYCPELIFFSCVRTSKCALCHSFLFI